jgi:hypothetical protein
MVGARTCSECGTPLSTRRPGTKTCSGKCRAERSRRTRRANREVQEFEESFHDGAQEIAAIVRREAPDHIKNVIQQELRPVVREAITEDTLRAIQSLLALAPRAVEAITEDLESDDAVLRQRAYTLIAKYTIGHPAIITKDETDSSKQIVVNFNLPRPDSITLESDEPEELKTCDLCDEVKPESEFMAGSDRCWTCFEEHKAKILAEFT